MSSAEEFPSIRPGGSLLLAWRIKDKNILIVGGGEVAASRIVKALEADAKVILICPEKGLNKEVRYRIENNQIHKWINREFQNDDLDEEGGIDMVLSAIDNPERSREICLLCREKKIPVNVADVPPMCDFYFMAEHRDGPLQISVSTNGKGPKMATMIRNKVAENLPNGIGDTIEKVGLLRQKLRQYDSEHKSSKKRMNWMSRICEEWTMEELKLLDENLINLLLQFYEQDHTPTYSSIIKQLSNKEQFDQNLKIDKKGKVILVGAGPGDPDLLTFKARQALLDADLVITDRLIPESLYSMVKCEVRMAPTKKSGDGDNGGDGDEGKKSRSAEAQDLLQSWCLKACKEGKIVVRLKIGDPFLFSRGGEEVLFFKENGCAVEVIAGISSALSAPMAANVPVTYRGLSNQVTIMTGQAAQGKLPEVPNYNPMCTLIALMAVGKAEELSKELLNKGYPKYLSAVFVENADRPNQRIIYATVESLGKIVEKENVISPSTLIIGRVVNAIIKNVNEENDNVSSPTIT
ncbi:11007_t:CDS:1 [Entrophospora sp. SA101]|nr:14857_t:CDS:1 [Entrophospora sp. SA101]CAJ0904130.1 11007_t:CDS:1 [Entrophospora sp. SA101]